MSRKKKSRKLPLNSIAAAVAALGVPGLILVVAMGTAAAGGLAGGAVITTALAAIGLGAGMVGGIAVLGVVGVLATAFTLYGAEVVMKAVLKELKRREHTKKQLLEQVDRYWISRGLKLKINEYVNRSWERQCAR